ncbi:MAG: AAA family ATPase [Phycisphaerales bacterium]|nr:AAA family ATPase [Phycisphaerales bacterium]
MRLAKLTLNGFKSFADRTEFTFDDSMTGIVGPNGCGKSNVVDAIKWVLGERSSKSLRGKEMIDVIFAGSAGRKPAGMASVVLSFDNPVVHRVPGTERVSETDRVPGSEDAPASEGPADGHDRGLSPDADQTASQSPESLATLDDLDDDLDAESGPTVIDTRVRGRRVLPIDADEVAVERRLFRDGTSQYLINNRRARLKDIRELFMDTGVGADAYSIIEQGKVDAMLLASPQERRTIFEEAAGIARYKQRRVESERKLERAIANLTVTREQLENTERRLRIVKGQAAKARRFKELDGELGAWRTALALEQYDDLRQRLDGLTSRLRDLEHTRAEATRILAEAEHDKQEAELARADALDEDRRLEQALAHAGHAAERAEQRRQMAERSVADLRRRRETDAARLEDLARRSAGLEVAAEDLAEQVAALAEQVGDAQRRLDAASEQRGLVAEQLASQLSAVAERRAAVTNIDRERAGLLASIAGDERRAEGVREQLARIADRRRALTEHAFAHAAEREALADQINRRKSDLATVETDLGAHESSADEMSADRRERAGALADLEQRGVRLESRRQTLQELIDARAGLGDAVREVLERKERREGFERVLAPLADLIEADEAAAASVETALGATLQALVVETVGDLPTAEELDTLPGRVAFVPISRLGSTPRRQVLDTAGLFGQRVTPLRTLVRARTPVRAPSASSGSEPIEGAETPRSPSATVETVNPERVEALLDRLLGETYLVPDLDAALLLASGPLAGRRMVTRQGCVLEPDGRIIAGPPGAADATGVLQQRGELTRLAAELADIHARLLVARDALARVDSQAAALNETMAALRHRQAAEQRHLAGESAKLDRLVAESDRLDREQASLAEDAEQTEQRLEKIDADREQLKSRADRLERLHADEETRAMEAQRALERTQAERDAMAERLSAARVDLSRHSEQASAARRDLNRTTIERDELDRQQRDLTTQMDQAVARAAEYEREIDESRTQADQASLDARRLTEEVGQARARLAAGEAEVQRLSERVLEARAHAHHIERDWHSLEVSRREIEVKRENLEDRTGEELGFELAFVYLEYRAMMADDADGVTVARVDTDQATTLIDALRAEIKTLGNVNLDSIEEEQNLASRNDELIRQVADIDHAREQLTLLIDKLNIVCRERFGETFARIQAEFGGSDGMFRKLFGGGRAEVRLMPLVKVVDTPDGPRKVETDETDLLESGIEVIAKPPGKEPRSISQLSGGEKTMTAVALLLSIFRSKPSCFCILDEVDAALDEANVGRYVDVVRQYTDQSHFIVITHNKRTMQAMDRLYGVTMQERGVSTRVAVKLEAQAGTEARSDEGTEAREYAGTEARRHEGTKGQTPAPIEPPTEGTPLVSDAAPAAPAAPPNGQAKKPSLRKALAALREEQAQAANTN